MARFINPFTDIGFKRIFGQPLHKDLLIDFLNGLLEGEKRIIDITFLDKELLPEFTGDRGLIYDVYCTNEDGEQFIVEMQNREQIYFRERALFYLSQAVARQGERGTDWKFNLKAVYGVFFMNFQLKGIMPDKLRTDVVLADRDTHREFSDKLRFIFLQLPCFRKEEDECENDFERWIYVLKNMETLHRLPFKARKAVFEKLEQIVDIAALSKEERMKYDESIKVYRDSMAILEYAKQDGWNKGIAKGFAQGMEQGLEQGIEQGIEQGQNKERLQNARRMIEKGYAAQDIADITGLSLGEINALASDL